MNKLLQSKNAILVSLVTIIIFLTTKSAVTKPYALQLTLLVLLLFAGYIIFSKRSNAASKKFAPTTTFLLFLVFVLFLVGTTGWSFSPFFFSLYLLAIMLAFIFSTAVSLAFTATLAILFSFSIGEIDLAYDFLIVLSLLSVIPVSFYLRKEYLRLKESSKEILVLEDKTSEIANKLEEMLANKVSNFSVNIRQPVNDTKQLAYMLRQDQTKEEKAKTIDRIVASSDEALRMLKKFEESVTGEKLVSTPASSKGS